MSEEKETWWINDAAVMPFGQQVKGAVLQNVHSASKCAGRHCVLHNPSDHHMREWPLNWRDDTKIMERLCPHGVGHPDPDDVAYQIMVDRSWAAIHGCDGCCEDPHGS